MSQKKSFAKSLASAGAGSRLEKSEIPFVEVDLFLKISESLGKARTGYRGERIRGT
jgi:hypothetical protein